MKLFNTPWVDVLLSQIIYATYTFFHIRGVFIHSNNNNNGSIYVKRLIDIILKVLKGTAVYYVQNIKLLYTAGTWAVAWKERRQFFFTHLLKPNGGQTRCSAHKRSSWEPPAGSVCAHTK